MAVLPLWGVAFVSLVALAGPGGPPPAPETAAEAAAQYGDVSTAGWIAWTVFSGAVLALNAVAVLWLGRAVHGLRRGRPAWGTSLAAAVCGLLYAVVTSYVTIGLKVSDPPSYAPLVEQVAVGVSDAKAWAAPLTYVLLTAATGLVAGILWREGVLGRAGLVIAGLGALFALAALMVPVPVLPAVVLFVLGLGILRARRSRAA